MSEYPLLGCVRCKQCKAKSKRTKQQCRAPAMKGKEVCRTHGGLSTGPKTKEGRARCAAAKTVHGREPKVLGVYCHSFHYFYEKIYKKDTPPPRIKFYVQLLA